MSKKLVWIALYSQSGNELQEVCKQLGRWPDAIICNPLNPIDINSWKEVPSITILSPYDKITADVYRKLFRMETSVDDELYVTLHGWLKIVPPAICDEFLIFNGHPGDIIKWPQLKGKDPQQKAFDLGLVSSGCIIHRVRAEVDDGEIMDATQGVIIKDCKTVDEVIAKLKKISIKMWKKFLTNCLKTL